MISDSKQYESDISVKRERGFSLIEVIVAGTLLIILSAGVLMVFSNVIERNRGENLRMQALSVLQEDIEYYRSLKFIPVGSDTQLNAGTYTNVRTRTAADGRIFNISVTINNIPATDSDADSRFKEIVIQAVPQQAESGWLSNLNASVTIQRVRSN